MYHAIEDSFTCQFASTTARAIPVALPVFLHYFDPDVGTLIISSPVRMKRVENVRQRPKVAILFSPVGAGPDEPKHVLLVQGLAEVDDTNVESGWKRYFAGWARRQPRSEEHTSELQSPMYLV